jgi:hypothetical protein
VTLLLNLANHAWFALVANPWLEPPTLRVPPEPEPDPHDFLPRRTRGVGPPKRLAFLGLLAAIAISEAIPSLGLTSAKTLKRDLRRYRGASGFVTQTSTIRPPELARLRTVLETSNCNLLTSDDNFELIMDSGCSQPVSPCEDDFVPGSLVDLAVPLAMDGIAGQLVAHKRGRLCYEILNDKGSVSVIVRFHRLFSNTSLFLVPASRQYLDHRCC